MTKDHDSLTASQFGAHARAYVESAVHAGGADLAALAGLAAKARPGRALDLGAGGGHVSYALAAVCGSVAAVDLSDDMLVAVAAEASRRGLRNVETVRASAEALPFPDAQFDFVASRFSAHHWRDAAAGLREARRVLRPGGQAVFIDIVSSGAPSLDIHLQAVELLRDLSHVRDYSLAEWTAMLDQAGFAVQSVERWRLRMDFAAWTSRIGTAAQLVEAIRILQGKASADVRSHFQIEDDGSFLLDAALLAAIAR
jgi:ubiquinone/menaquinone biosynthesis C-methylase UbiE